MKIRRRLLTAILCASLLGGIGFYASNSSAMTVKADTTAPSSTQGKIIVHYVDQNGAQIRPDTVATGAAGTTYVATVPQIKGYTYSSIENGQNDANGPQMVFGGGDPVTAVMSMTIVYTANSSKSDNNSSDNNSSNKNNSTATTPAKNGKKSTKNNVTPSSNNDSSNSNKTTDHPSSKKDDSKSSKKPVKTDKDKDNKDKKNDVNDNHHVIWIIGGVILALVVIAGVWKFMKKPSSDRH